MITLLSISAKMESTDAIQVNQFTRKSTPGTLFFTLWRDFAQNLCLDFLQKLLNIAIDIFTVFENHCVVVTI